MEDLNSETPDQIYQIDKKPIKMTEQVVKVKSVKKVTHDVLRIVTEKPENFSFISGQATEISINKDNWRNEKRPFTFTCLNDDDYLEFTIKTYPEKKGVTNELLNLKKNDELILHDVFGAIHYKGEGIFIAGGAGVTPFISIIRDLAAKRIVGNNILIFANKTKDDIINEEEFRRILGKNFVNILCDEKVEGYLHGLISEDLIEAYDGKIKDLFYLCGPPPMMDALDKMLEHLHIPLRSIIKEEF
jgi:predicted ferric reductase